MVEIISDDRGTLIPIDFNRLPFVPKRIFIVDNVPKNSKRGGHAHKKCQQILVCTNGKINVKLISVNGGLDKNLLVGDSIFHDKMEWAELTFVKPESRLLSICSENYDEEDYIRDWNKWVELTGGR